MAMAMGSLARYRKIFMISAFGLFLLGALGKWHRERQLGVVEEKGRLIDTPDQSWKGECISYACRPLAAGNQACDSLCDQAMSAGLPTVQAERIAVSCKRYCVAEGTDTAECATQCFIREAKKTARRSEEL